MLRALTLLACSLATGVAEITQVGGCEVVGFCVRSPDYGLRTTVRKNSSGTAQALASAQEQLSGLFSRKSGTAAEEKAGSSEKALHQV